MVKNQVIAHRIRASGGSLSRRRSTLRFNSKLSPLALSLPAAGYDQQAPVDLAGGGRALCWSTTASRPTPVGETAKGTGLTGRPLAG